MPNFETLQGEVVVDGSLVPSVGLLEEPIRLGVDRSMWVKLTAENKRGCLLGRSSRDRERRTQSELSYICLLNK